MHRYTIPFLAMTIIDSKPLAIFGSTRRSFLPLMYNASFDDFIIALNCKGCVAPEISSPKVAVALPGMSTFSLSSVTSWSTTVSFCSIFTAVICKLNFETAGAVGFCGEGYPAPSIVLSSPEVDSELPLPV